MTEEFRLQLTEFEGPLDLLLYLVRRDDIDILSLSVTDVAQQYVDFVEQMQSINLDIASEYLVMAATLAWMKSRLMLPRVDEDDPEIEDMRAELIQRLLEYERYKKAAETLEDRPLMGRELFPASAQPDLPDDQERPWAPVSVFALMEAFAEVLANMPDGQGDSTLNFVLSSRTVEQGARSLASWFKRGSRFLLRDILSDAADRAEVIVRFLALLELVKSGELVAVVETGGEGEIHLARRDPQAPMPDYSQIVKGNDIDGTPEDRDDS